VIESWKALPANPKNDFIFGSPYQNQPYSVSHIGSKYRKARKQAELKAKPGDGAVRAHDGRRSFASRLNSKNVSIYTIQKLLGHAQIATTETYLSADETDLAAAHQQLDASARRPPQAITPPDESTKK
jgi:integrase/recombinase XerD